MKLVIRYSEFSVCSSGYTQRYSFGSHEEMGKLLNLDLNNKISNIKLKITNSIRKPKYSYSAILGWQSEVSRLEKLQSRINKALMKTNDPLKQKQITIRV